MPQVRRLVVYSRALCRARGEIETGEACLHTHVSLHPPVDWCVQFLMAGATPADLGKGL